MRALVSLSLVLAPLVVGCNGDTRGGKSLAPVAKVSPEKTTPTSAKPAADPGAVEPKPTPVSEPWGIVKGRIVWGGKEIPKRAPVLVPNNHNDRLFCLSAGPFLDEIWIVHPQSKGLRNTFVWLAPVDKDGKLTIHPARVVIQPSQKYVVLDQPICMFVPYALAIREGQILVVKNSAKVPHSFKWSGNPDVNPGANVVIAPGGKDAINNLKADRFPIGLECGFHPWMKGWIRVFDHPYYAVTDQHGNFQINDAPAGPCRLMIWHAEGWLGGREGRNGRPLAIVPGVNDVGALEYPPPPPSN